MNWGTWLMALAGPLASRALFFLGFGILTITGVTAVVDLMISALDTYWQGLPSAVLSLASLAGVPEGLGLVVGARLARVALWVKLNGGRMVIRAANV